MGRRPEPTCWQDGFDAYLHSYEVRLHRRMHTYGGKIWPPSKTSGRIPADRQLQIALAATERTA